MKLKLPEKFAKLVVIQEHLRKISLFETIIFYLIDWRVRKAVNLKKWINEQLKDEILNDIINLVNIKEMDTNKIKVKKVLKFVHENIRYRPDKLVWDTSEKWQTPSETWEKKTGDCDDFAILIYCLLNKFGVPDTQLRIIAGDVIGGGHCYVCWLSDEDGIEYPIDGTYWYSTSYKMITPYVQRKSYNYGQTEWFSFNSIAGYKTK